MDQADDLRTGDLVSVFKTADPALMPLATMALEADGIDYSVRGVGKTDSLKWMMSVTTKFPNVMEIVVAPDVADRARELVADLTPQDATALAESAVSLGIELEDASTGMSLGILTEAQWQELTSRLAEHGPNEYFIDADALHALEEADADVALINLLRHAVGDAGSRTVRWKNL